MSEPQGGNYPKECNQSKSCHNSAIDGRSYCEGCLAKLVVYRARLKRTVFDHYGGCKCACCGETEFAFLVLDHVDGNGNAQRRSIAGFTNYGGMNFHRWLIKNDFPDGFQVLCFNCNNAKAYNPGGCPHVAQQ